MLERFRKKVEIKLSAMAYAAGQSNMTGDKKLIDPLIADLITLSYECKRKYPPIKEAAEACQLKVRGIGAKSDSVASGLIAASSDVVQPFIMGCDTKNPKIVQMSLTAIQRQISQKTINLAAADNIVNALWSLMEAAVEELKLLQTAILLITTSSVVQHETLAKALVLCFRLHFAKDSTTTNTAAATIRQLVSVIFERMVVEDSTAPTEPVESVSLDELKAVGKQPPKSLRPSAADAYLLFQDFCLLLNADQPHWLLGMTEMTRTLCLELMEEVLSNFHSIFIKHEEFSFLLSERVCPLVIRLFSPSLKYRTSRANVSPSPVQAEKPFFPIVMRLLRIVAVLIRYYYKLLITECEIFLSLLVKFLDPEKPQWQRVTALEVLSKLCVQRQLIRSFCESYDMKPHSTKIFRDIVNGLGAFIQSQFMGSSAQAPPSAGVKLGENVVLPQTSAGGGVNLIGGYTPQPAFCYRNVWIPLIINVSLAQTSHKAVYLEMLDKNDPPSVPDGYGLSLAFLCMLDIVKCIQGLLEKTPPPPLPENSGITVATADATNSSKEAESETDKQLKEELINSSWCGVLAATSLLLDASSDDGATEAILKSLQAFVSMCGQLDLNTPRDAFITALCKSSLPAHYALHILNTQNMADQKGMVGRGSSQQDSQPSPSPGHGEGIQGNQVVAVGTPLATSSLPLGTHQGPVMLTAKNIHCMRALLNLSHCHGGVLGTAWHQILTTLQHLVWILGLKPSSGGSLKPAQMASDNPNAVITTSIVSDLPILSAMLSRLFESSQYLDEVALHHLIDALCKLSSEAMDVGFSNREPSLFAVAKLLETGLVNMSRVDVLWRPVTGHLLEVCQHPHQGLRTWAAEAVTSLIKAGLFHKYEPPLHMQMKLQAKLLLPLQELSGIVHGDVRQKQLDCVLVILQNIGEQLNDGWPLILGVIGAITNDQGESLIRPAFQSLQLVVTDFLPSMSCSCLQICIEVAAKFGLQNQELNISLTAVGLLWNIADHISQNRVHICDSLSTDASAAAATGTDSGRQVGGGGNDLPPFDALWMVLYTRLGDLCVDQRPAVRKSAGQTLFSMIAAHGSLLQKQTWHTVLWKVLFPLLDRVKHLSSVASDSREDTAIKSGNILMHHSRDTAEKQWAETRFLTLAGVARVFNMKRSVLRQLGDFLRAWALLLEFIESSALCQNAEVSLAALKSFQEILNMNKGGNGNGDSKSEDLKMLFNKSKTGDGASSGGGGAGAAEQQNDFADHDNIPDDLDVDDMTLWSNAWRVWQSIGMAATAPPETSERTARIYVPSQAFLTALVQTFPALYDRIRNQFVAAELQKLFSVLQRALCVPVHGSAMPYIVPLGELSALTPLQEAVLGAVRILGKDALSGSDNMAVMYPDMFNRLLAFVEFAVHPPKFGKIEIRSAPTTTNRNNQNDWVAMNYVPFSEAIIELIVDLYKATAKSQSVVQNQVLQNIIKVFRLPLRLKYGCPSQSTWLLTINSLLTMLTVVGLPIAKKNESAFQGMWIELGNTLEDFLFSQHPLPNSSVDDFQRDEAIDCRVIQLIRDEILPSAKKLPHEFIVRVMVILNKGSIHSVTSACFIDIESSHKLREEFAKSCFETLLRFSFVNQKGAGGVGNSGNEEVAITHLAIESLLERCKTVLEKFVADERLSGKCPLPRPRLTEMSFVLKAISTLVFTLKKTSPTAVDRKIWKQVIDLYPSIVDCTTSASANVNKALKEALVEYGDLLAPPSAEINGAYK